MSETRSLVLSSGHRFRGPVTAAHPRLPPAVPVLRLSASFDGGPGAKFPARAAKITVLDEHYKEDDERTRGSDGRRARFLAWSRRAGRHAIILEG